MTEQPKSQEPAPQNTVSRPWQLFRAILRRVENILFGLVLVFITFYLVLQMPAVQNWLINKITGYLSGELQTKVEIRHVDISFFDNVLLDGFYVEDLKGDTLLYAGTLKASLNSNVFSLLNSKLEFDEISLYKARFNIRRAEGEYDNNLQFLIDYFSSPRTKPPKKPSPFSVRVQNLRLRDVEFLQDDAVRGQRMLFRVPSGNIRVNNLDLPSKIVDIRSADFNGFSFFLEERPGHPLPERATPLATAISSSVDSIALALPKQFFQFSVERFSLSEGQFKLDKFGDSPNFVSLPDVMDYEHLRVYNIDLQADSVQFTDDLVFEGILRNLSASERCGFILSHVEAERVLVNDTLTALYGTRIQTPFTSLGDTVAFHYSSYRDYRKFNDKVSMDIRLKEGSRVRIADINFFSEGLAGNKFFAQNKDEIAEISGVVNGAVNHLRGRNLDIKLDDNTYMKGQFIGDDLAGNRELLKMGFKFDELHANLRTISRIIPGFAAPDYFYKLGNIGFEGNYDVIFGSVHILYGDISTDIGAGRLDMELDLTNGKDEATYAGNLYMKDFDLADWTGNNDFGKTTFRVKIEEPSKGLTLRTMDTRLAGSVDTFFFRGYNYQNVSLNGQFKNKVFHGDLGLDDQNIRFKFRGDINMQDSVTLFDFNADLQRLDLGALNLLDEDWILSGNIEQIKLRAQSLDDLTGTVLLRDFLILQDHETTHQIDSLVFTSDYEPSGARAFRIRSDILDAALFGQFSLSRIPGNLMQLLSRQHPKLAAQLGFPAPDSSIIVDDYTIGVTIRDSRGLTHLLAPELDTLRDIVASARVVADRGSSRFMLLAPHIKYNGLEMSQVGLFWSGEPDTSYFSLRIPQSVVSGKYVLSPIDFSSELTEDDLHFKLEAKDSTSIVESVNLDGVLSTVDSLWQIKFNASEIALFKTEWYMDEDNYIRFGKDFFEPRNFDLMSGDLRINLDGTPNHRGLRLSSANFDLDFLNGFVNDTTLDIHGRISAIDVGVQELYQLRGIESNIEIEELFVKGKSYNSFYGFAQMAYVDAPIRWRFVTQKGIEEPSLVFTGAWLPSGKEPVTVERPDVTVNPGEFQSIATARGFPLVVLETFVPGISKTSGELNADVTLSGTFNYIAMEGEARIPEGQFQLDYLKTMYHLHDQKVALSEYKIWVDGDTIWDATERNMAIVKGGLNHDHFRNWSLACSIESTNSNFLVLNTLPDDNPLYYGQGIGKFKAVFSGTFSRTNIVIDATTGSNTRLYIPVTNATEAQSINFIKFVDKNAARDSTAGKPSFVADELKGLNLEMNLTVTEDAEVQLIFDEKAGDIIKGRGEGDITLTMNREGEFKMYGSYRIKHGEYLFTLLNWVNKPFTMTEGGTVNWFGDPYGAQINLDATYEENTSLYNFLRDEVELLPFVSAEVSKATKVVVTMHLKGELLKPNISFDLDFPNISSQLKTITDNKLRRLRLDQNELNRQVFGLVVVGSFLPSNSGGFIQNSDYLTSAFNTLTQVLSNQFSNYLTGLAAEWFGGAVSSIDFDIAYNEYQNVLSDPSQPNISQIGRELQVRLTSGFANDRVTIQFGSQFGLGRPGTTVQEGFLGEDVTVEIQLTENRQWRLKVYQRTEPDIAGSQRRARYGFGISFRKDYDTFDDMMSGLTAWFRKKS
ncbi:MAG: translocation/assembly module TamB [Saprospiraceae bacterium]|nr:translocation/assembly module TamB [Saprospiraceae bacterium]